MLSAGFIKMSKNLPQLGYERIMTPSIHITIGFDIVHFSDVSNFEVHIALEREFHSCIHAFKCIIGS